MVDAYRQPYIPFYLTTREFFELARERLAPGGVVIVNVGHPEGSEELERVLGRTMAAAFPYVLRDPIEPTNTLLLAGEGTLSTARLLQASGSLPQQLRRPAREAASRLTPRLPGGEIYSDDHAPSSGWSTPPCWNTPMATRAKAWLVTGPLGRGLAFAIDFAVAVRRGLLRRNGV